MDKCAAKGRPASASRTGFNTVTVARQSAINVHAGEVAAAEENREVLEKLGLQFVEGGKRVWVSGSANGFCV